MKREELLKFHRAADLTPDQLVTQAPDLFTHLEDLTKKRIKIALADRFAKAPEPLRKHVSRLRLPTLADPQLDLKSHLRASLDRSKLTPEAKQEGEEHLQQLADVLDDPLYRDVPLSQNPLVSQELELARLHRIADAAHLDTAKAELLVAATDRHGVFDDAVLVELVDAGKLAEDEAKRFGLTANLHDLLQGEPNLAAVIATRVDGLQDVALLDTEAWQILLEQEQVEPPDGQTRADHAAELAGRTAALFPDTALIGRLASIPERLDERLATLDESARQRFANRYPGLGVAKVLADSALTDEQKAQRIAGGVGLLERARRQNARLNLLRLDYTPDSEGLAALDFTGFSSKQQGQVLNVLKTYQRTYSLTEDVSLAQSLIEAGYHSASEIAGTRFETFLESTHFDTAIATQVYRQAQDTVGSAAALAGTLLEFLGAPLSWLRVCNQSPEMESYLKKLPGLDVLFGTQATCRCEHCQSLLSPAAYFVDLMAFVEKHVLDVYFTGDREDHVLNLRVRRPDLWQLPLTCENTQTRIPTLEIVNEILENYIGGGNLTDRNAIEATVYRKLSTADDSFHQPFVLPLERLKIYLEHFGESLGSIARVVEPESDQATASGLGIGKAELLLMISVDDDINFLKQLYGVPIKLTKGTVDPFDATLLLRPMGVDRDELGRLLETHWVLAKDPATCIQAEKTDKESVQNDIERIYGLTRRALDRLHRFTRLWRRLPWSIGELDLVLRQLGAKRLDRKEIRAVVALLALGERLKVGVEELLALVSELPQHATEGNGQSLFDRLFNPPFLTRSDGSWPAAGTDFVHPAFRADATSVPEDHTLHRLLGALRVSDEELHGLIVHLAKHLGAEPTPREEEGTGEVTLPRISLTPPHLTDETVGVGVRSQWRVQLTRLYLAAELDCGFPLSRANLNLLYRHARLIQLLDLGVDELFELIALADLPGQVREREDLEKLLDFHDWWKSTDYSLDDLSFITGRPVTRPAGYPEPKRLAERVVAHIQEEGVLTFADTLFAFLEGVTEAQSRHLVQGHVDKEAEASHVEGRFDVAEESPRPPLTAKLLQRDLPEERRVVFVKLPEATGYRLAAGVDPAAERLPLILPSELTTELNADEIRALEDGIRRLLKEHCAGEALLVVLAGELGLAVEKTRVLVAMTGEDLLASEFLEALLGVESGSRSETESPVLRLVEKLLPLTVLFQGPEFDPEPERCVALELIRAHPDLFGLDDFTDIGMASVRKLSIYGQRVGTPRDTRFTPVKEPVKAAEVSSVLKAFDPSAGFAVQPETLARVVGAESGLVLTVAANVDLPDTAPEALGKLVRAVAFARRLGISGEALGLMMSDEYDDLTRASEAVLGAFRAKYPEEDDWLEQLEPFEDRIRGLKRDALVKYLIHSGHPQFQRESDLYHHFLIDVELEGCARTSWVVSAISSVQLYVHRILMNLEQDDRGPGDSQRVRVPPESIPTAEWSRWRKNYRVWEANRKVFLYPENYLEPELRDNKSPLFEKLESELLQQEVNDQTVLDAYASYLAGFEEVARLEIAGAYHDLRGKVDVLHLLGVTSSDPPTFYYRTIENPQADGGKVWSPWRPIDVQIPVRKAAPVLYNGRLYIFWVEFSTRPLSEVKDGNSNFTGYRHTMRVKYTALRVDGSWMPPQELSLALGIDPFKGSSGLIEDTLEGLDEGKHPRFGADRPHKEPEDDYRLQGPSWEELYLDPSDPRFADNLSIAGRNFRLYASVDFDARRAGGQKRDISSFRSDLSTPFLCSRPEKTENDDRDHIKLYYGYPPVQFCNANASANLILEHRRIASFEAEIGNIVSADRGLYVSELATVDTDTVLTAVSGSIQDVILQHHGDSFVMQGLKPAATGSPTWRWQLVRIGTTLSHKLGARLFSDGVNGLLDTSFQMKLKEAETPFLLKVPRVVDHGNAGKLDFGGPYGLYYREIFFHIPFMIANHLNSRSRYAAAQRWYHYIFDPTAADPVIHCSGICLDLLAAPLAQRKASDRVWRYLEFRNIGLPQLRQALTNPDAIEVYKKDPFNPHAIARLRLAAYQKATVMKYIDNLLDWGDHLFTQFTTESVNEAILLYVLAADILGPRPPQLGECGEGKIQPKTYGKIGPLMKARPRSGEKKPQDFLIELETFVARRDGEIQDHLDAAIEQPMERFYHDHSMIQRPLRGGSALKTGDGSKSDEVPQPDCPFHGLDWKSTATGGWSSTDVGSFHRGGVERLTDQRLQPTERQALLSSFGSSVVSQVSPVFCVPANKELLAYWDRVEDRLFKIRHCMDIQGVRRELALFAPEIDPRLLVRARAAGLSFEDVLGATSGDLPPYRFSYLIGKAKEMTGTVQSFGNALLSALEKKDAEELILLRAVHEQNLLKLNGKVRGHEIKVAEEIIAGLNKQIEAARYRLSYYKGLLDGDLTPWERTQQVARHTSSISFLLASTLSGSAGILSLLPQLGSPFAMKYGGVELGTSADRWAKCFRDTASVAEVVAASAGLEAGFDRRRQDWEHQRTLAEKDLENLKKQKAAAKIRHEIAVKSLEVHEKTIEQAEEVFELYADKFSNLGLYTWLATTLQRLYREAYNSAFAMARLAEQAFHFERGEPSGVFEGGASWQAGKAGLTAGEGLLLDLQNLERRFLETNYRQLEIEQSLSLIQIDPAALIRLRETGSTEDGSGEGFMIPEFFFDLYYPGQYRRKIKAVRLTIPCVTGPYTNVGATLRLLGSEIRMEPKLGAEHIKPVPLQRTVAIATSNARNDAGVFELNFRDERYMPFEGAGAVNSRWQLELPKSFRSFDYQTISDVILTISYTAEEDGKLRQDIEKQNAMIEGTLLTALRNKALVQLFSLRHEFPSEWHRFLNPTSETGDQTLTMTLTERFPFFLQERTVKIEKMQLFVKVDSEHSSGYNKDTLMLSLGEGEDASSDWLELTPWEGLLKGEKALAGSLGPWTLTGGLLEETDETGDRKAGAKQKCLNPDAILDILLLWHYTCS